MIEFAYILGSTRSGTSALRNALCETRFMGYGEGHLVPLLTDLAATVRRHAESGFGARSAGNGLYRLRPDDLLAEIVAGYERYVSAQLASASIVDKTPTVAPIRAAPLLNALHGRPFFIHCMRRHVDNVASKRAKFPGQDFETHCSEWAGCAEAWLEAREGLDGNFVEFDFIEMATDPQRVVARIGGYLGLDGPEMEAAAAYLARRRPQAEAGRDVARFATLAETGWSAAERAAF